MRTKSASGLPVVFTRMPFIMVFIEAANAWSAELVAGFIAMPFMSSARAVCADDRNVEMTRAAKTVEAFIMRFFRRERRWVGRLDPNLRIRWMQPKTPQP